MTRRTMAPSALTTILIAVLTGLAACSAPQTTSTESAGGEFDPKASEAVATYSSPVTSWDGPVKKFKPPAQQSVTILTCGSTGITCVRAANGAAAAASELGWTATIVDGKNQPTVWNSSLQTAISSGTDAIVLAAVPPAAVAGAMKAARDKGIPVVALLSSQGAELVTHVIELDQDEVGRLLADAVAVQSGGTAKILALHDSEFPEIVTRFAAFDAELAEVCPGCTVVAEHEFTLALASQRVSGIVSSALSTNPEIDYVVQPFDAITPFVQQGIRAGASSAKIVGVGADPPSVQALKSGEMAASIGTPAEWLGWMGIDAVARALVGEPIPEYEVPARVITQDSAPGAEGWQGDFDYASAFVELWDR